MNLRKTCPNISDSWKGGISATCRVLGEDNRPISANTLRRYAALPVRRGGIKFSVSKSGKMQFTGKEVKRFWRGF